MAKTQTRARPQPSAGDGAVFSLRVIDRRSGLPLRTNGAARTIFTRLPHQTAAEMLRDRDPATWDVLIEPLAADGAGATA